jgi:hypothetical protein
MIIKNYKNFRVLLAGFFLMFLSACSNRPSNFLMDKLEGFGTGVKTLFSNTDTIYGLMFVAILFGTFALYKALLRFAFRRTDQFKNKEINVIAFMVSIMSTAGIFYMFRDDANYFILLFGGSAGLLFVLFIVFFIMRLFYESAENIKDEEGLMKKGPGWIFLIVLGVLFSSYLLLGYSGKIIEGLGCNFADEVLISAEGGGPISCSQAGTGFFVSVANFLLVLKDWAIILAIIFGIWWLINRNKKDDDGDSDDKDKGPLSKIFGGKSEEDKEKDKEKKSKVKNIKELLTSINEHAKKSNSATKEINKLEKQMGDYLNSVENSSNSSSSGNSRGGNN